MKTTAKVVQDKVKCLQDDGHDIGVSFQGLPPQPTITNREGTRDLSPALRPQDAWVWLDGFVAGHKCASEDAEHNNVERP